MGEVHHLSLFILFLMGRNVQFVSQKLLKLCSFSIVCLHIKHVWWHIGSPLGSTLGRQPRAVELKRAPVGRGACRLLHVGMAVLGDQASRFFKRSWNLQMLCEICFEIGTQNWIFLKPQCGPTLLGKTKTRPRVISSPQAIRFHTMD